MSHSPHSQIREIGSNCVNMPRIKLDHFDIIGRSSNEQELRILEPLLIHSQKPKLNNLQYSYPLFISLF